MTSERAITKAIVAYLRSEGCWVFKVHGGALQMAGVPDLLVCHRGRFVALEVKKPGQHATQLQAKRMFDIDVAGGVTAVVSSVDEARMVLGDHQE